MLKLESVLDAYVAGGAEVRAAFAGMTREQLVARPVPGKWSSLEVLCHLVDAEMMTASRVRTALLPGETRVAGLTGEQLTATQAPHERDVAEEIELFDLVRRQTARIVRAAGEEALAKELTILKPDQTQVQRSVGAMIEGITPHSTRHLVHVHEKRRALGI